MNKFLISIILFANVYLASGQEKFEAVIDEVCRTLNFELTSGEIVFKASPEAFLVERIKKCSSEPELAELSKLDFSSIVRVKIAKIKSLKAKDNIYDRITCKEWVFETDQQAGYFLSILDQVDPLYAQFCICKGGFLWWRDNNSIFVLSSGAFVSTFKYDDIKNIFESHE